MQLPQDLQHFPHLTLIVLSDQGRSKFFLAGGESLEELDGVALPAQPLPDHEGSFVPGSNKVDEERLKHYIASLTEMIGTLTQKHEIAHVHVVMPAEIEHMLTAALSPDVSSKIGKRLHADLMNEAPLDVVRRLVG